MDIRFREKNLHPWWCRVALDSGVAIASWANDFHAGKVHVRRWKLTGTHFANRFQCHATTKFKFRLFELMVTTFPGHIKGNLLMVSDR